MKAYFEEEQKFRQWWLWLILLCSGVVPFFGFLNQILLNKEFANNTMTNTQILIYLGISSFFLIFFWFLKLKTKIDQNGIRFYFAPFIKKTIKWHEIKSAKVINYGFVGGWGIRLWTKYGTVYNVKGNKGIAIELINGKKLLIGTQKESEIKNILNKFQK